MKDLDPSPIFAMLCQSLLEDAERRDAIVSVLSEFDDVKDQFKGEDLKTKITERITELVSAAGSVPLGYKRASGRTVYPAGGYDAVAKRLPEAAAIEFTGGAMPFEFVTLVGYLGPGAISGTVRLYSDPTLEDFTSLREDDVVLRHRFHTENAPFDEVDVVWVKRTATIGRDRRQPRRLEVEAQFLEGELMDAAEADAAVPTRIEGARSDEPFCVSYTCCKRTSVCRPPR